MEFHYVISIQFVAPQLSNAACPSWQHGVYTARPGDTRETVLSFLRDKAVEEGTSAFRKRNVTVIDPIVTFFSLEPNELPRSSAAEDV